MRVHFTAPSIAQNNFEFCKLYLHLNSDMQEGYNKSIFSCTHMHHAQYLYNKNIVLKNANIAEKTDLKIEVLREKDM